MMNARSLTTLLRRSSISNRLGKQLLLKSSTRIAVSSLSSSDYTSTSFVFSSSSKNLRRRWNHSTATKTDDDDDDKDDNTTGNTGPRLLYTSPMGSMITRLKLVSITSCVMSVVGLPLLIFLKNGDFPTLRQFALGGVAFMGATGSTLALHFVFGPYILNLYEIPIRQCHNDDDAANANEKAGQEFLLQATTRSVFGWKKEHVFHPLTDVTHYAGMRPFANFVVKGDTTLYAHPYLLDDDTRLKLLHPTGEGDDDDKKSKEEGKISKKKQDDDDDDGLF